MRRILILCSLSAVLLSACNKSKLPINAPKCIINKITTIQNEPVRNPAAKVYSYEYKGETVYFIPSYCCDMFSELYDADCNFLCSPDGGFTGGGDGACTDFFTERKGEKLVWEDNR